MKILIKALAKSPGKLWQVRLDGEAITFRSEAEARAFVDTLQARIQAPTVSPRPAALCRWLTRLSDLRLRGPCPLQALGRHCNRYRQHAAQADDHGHRHRRTIMQHADQRRRTRRHAELDTPEQRRGTARPCALPAHGTGRGVRQNAAQAGDADK